MAQEMKQSTILVTLLTKFLLFCEFFPIATCESRLILSNESKLNKWLDYNIEKFKEANVKLNQTCYKLNKMESNLDGALATAEAGVKVITVKKDGSGNFQTVSDAINSIPMSNANRVVIKIGGGSYWEKITIDRSKQFITFYGDPNDMPKICFNGTAAQYGTVYSSTVAIESDYFVAVNIEFVNTAPMPDGKREGAQAVAMRISGDKSAFYHCKFIGTVDFIFGDGQSLYLNTTIRSVSSGIGVITAHARENESEESGFEFVHCSIIGAGKTKLGRAWKQRPRMIFAHTYMDTVVSSEGWADDMSDGEHKPVYYGEYKCWGPGGSSSGRAKFVRMLSDEEAQPFLSTTFINGNNWIIPPPKV
ncbi:hypothetical protein Patl1_26001 [Pistacia atlantica]|uniref:Uncharacterized protein n=1 Tax=Pistacia atlantica TaxID=434234 RepID=A0ACC1AYT2_9ROSI|nr:hypothetical protein Patl1_26001 [Pistacia atlantica]